MAIRTKLQGWVELGGQTVSTAGFTSTTNVQKSFTSATVTVFLAGTSTLATLYSNATGTAKANPFTTDSQGFWFFFANSGSYDVRFSGGGIVTPFTLSSMSTDSAGDVSSFGAIGDGVADDTAALQACIDAANNQVRAAQASSGSSTGVLYGSMPVVELPGGHRYKITADLVVPKYMTIKSDGTASIEQATTTENIFTMSDAYQNRFIGLNLIGGNNAFYISNANTDTTQIYIDYCSVQLTRGHAIYTYGTVGDTSGTTITTGTVDVTNNSRTVSGTGTAFTVNHIGEMIKIVDSSGVGRIYMVDQQSSATAIRLAKAYEGATQTGRSYIQSTATTDDWHLSATIIVSNTKFYNNAKIYFGLADMASFRDCWFTFLATSHYAGGLMANNTAQFEIMNGRLLLDHCVEVPGAGSGGTRATNVRMVDTLGKNAFVHIHHFRFGGEDSGMPAAYTFAPGGKWISVQRAVVPFGPTIIIDGAWQLEAGTPTSTDNSIINIQTHPPQQIVIRDSNRVGQNNVPVILNGGGLDLAAYFGAITTPSNGFIYDINNNQYITSATPVLVSDSGGNADQLLQFFRQLTKSVSYDFPAVGANAAQVVTGTVNGARAGDAVTLGLPDAIAGALSLVFNAWVSANNTVSIRAANYTTAGTADPGAATFLIVVTKPNGISP